MLALQSQMKAVPFTCNGIVVPITMNTMHHVTRQLLTAAR